jgi:hypothetical protein
LAFGVPSPSGERIAAVSACVGEGVPSALAIVAGDDARLIRLPVEWNGAAPAWLDPRRVAVPGLDRIDAAATAIIDVGSTTVSDGPHGVRAIAVSADGRLVATVGDDQRTVSIGSVDTWIASGGATRSPHTPRPGATIAPEPAGIVAALALDAGGRSLAVAWTDADLVPSVIVRYDAGTGWHGSMRVSLPAGTMRAAVAFVPADAGASGR